MGSSSQAAPAFVRLAGHPLRWRLLTELAHRDLRVRELVTLAGQPQNLVSYHLRLLRGGGLVTATRSSFDGRDSYYHLDLDRCAQELAGTGAALHPALRLDTITPAPPPRPSRLSVLFVCTGNSARSPIAEALLRQHTAGHVAAISAGSRPKPRLHPNTVRVLRDHYGVDVAAQRPRHLDTLTGRRFDYVITLCDKAREVCPEFDGRPRLLHWSVPDPTAAGDSDQAGPASSGARATPADATSPGRNRIHLIVDDLDAEIDRLGGGGLSFRSDLVSGPGGRQILLADPAGNLIELFQPAHQPAAAPTRS